MYLQKIIDYKKEEIKSLKEPARSRTRPLYDPVSSLRKKPLIAEIKKASPSMGDINTGIDVADQAVKYQKGGAGCISVLTDKQFFKGGYELLDEVSQHVAIPVLCKDFIISEIQIEHAYVNGADFILLIAAVLNTEEIERLKTRADKLKLKILYELHEPEEFKKISRLDPQLVGVNSRNLKSFAIDKKAACNTISIIKGDFIKIAESGIESADDIASFKKAGAQAFLIGTTLMKSSDPVKKLKEFQAAMEVASCS